MDRERRRFLYASGIAAATALAGCSSAPSDDAETTADTTIAGTADGTTTTAGTTTGGGGGAPPGADQLGGPDDLQSSASVRATTLDSDRGAGRFVNTPAVVWVQEGATVTWQIEGASHSVTAYHPDNDRPMRIPEGASSFDSGTQSAGTTFEHTFSTPGVYNYFCRPHEGLGMVGLVIVGGPQGGPGTTPPDTEQSQANSNLERLLNAAGVMGGGDGDGNGDGGPAYDFVAATSDTYWYSLYNMSTNIAMSGNGVTFPRNDQQRQTFRQRVQAITKNSDVDGPPIRNPNLNVLPFTSGDPSFTQQPVFDAGDGRPDASTLQWDPSKASKVVSPASLAWTHLKGLTWVKNFENHFDVLPQSLAPKFRSQVLTTMAQLGIKAGLIDGGPNGDGLLTKGDSLELLPGVNVAQGQPTGQEAPVGQYAAVLWFLSDFVSVAEGGWYGYENPEPLIPAGKIQQLADGVAQTIPSSDPSAVTDESTRTAGLLLGAIGWYGTHAGSDSMARIASESANALADEVEANLAGNGRVENGAPNQAATQGIVGQGLTWASQLDGVDRTSTAENVLGYLLDELWDADAKSFASGTDDTTYTYTARDAGDLTGGINAADAVLGLTGAREKFARAFDQAFNRGRLQRAERPPSRDESAAHTLPLPPKAGGEFGQAAVYNAEVQYDTGADEWSVTDRTFDTEGALYLANQDIWMSHWSGDFFQGRGVPGKNDTPK